MAESSQSKLLISHAFPAQPCLRYPHLTRDPAHASVRHPLQEVLACAPKVVPDTSMFPVTPNGCACGARDRPDELEHVALVGVRAD